MNIGIVGHEAAKFTPETEAKAKAIIRDLLSDPLSVCVSGHCHLGGIDIWAEEIADLEGRRSSMFRKCFGGRADSSRGTSLSSRIVTRFTA